MKEELQLNNQELLNQLEENNLLLSEASSRLVARLQQLEDPIGRRNWTDAEIDSGKRPVDIIETEIQQAIQDVAKFAETRASIKKALTP